mmetsp:Transcript_51809/g.108265  ORF Transcript_51809/g.108265 Transcript_51809/m.108265 type:complete len:83 (-) Transcript_51809:339-587(-)
MFFWHSAAMCMDQRDAASAYGTKEITLLLKLSELIRIFGQVRGLADDEMLQDTLSEHMISQNLFSPLYKLVDLKTMSWIVSI